MHKGACVQMAQTVVGADPDVAVAVLKQRAGAEISQTIAYLIVLCASTGDTAHSFIGSYPHGAILALQECPHKVIDQSLRRVVVDDAAMGEAVDAAAVGADPKIAGAVAIDIADGYVW